MADQKIELEIVLDDGSIKRAFGSIKKEAEDTGNIFGNAFKINSVTDLASAITLADKALTLFKGTADALLNQVLAGEKIDAINKRFEILAQQAGISADALSTGIAVAVDGTVDMEEALQATSSSLINLEVGLNKIPQLFEIARKSAAGFSGDTISNFERIQQAVITGNTKSLKEIGIFINAASAIDNYEIAIGAAKGTLTEANKQQAILNEVLKVGDERFKNINTSITPVDESVKKLKVSYGELGDTVANFSNNILGAIFTERLNSARTSLDAFNIKLGEWLLGKAPTASENIKLLTYQLQELEKSLLMAQVRGDVDRATQIMAEKEALTQKLAVEKEAVNTQTQKNLADLQGNALNKDKQTQMLAITDAMREQFVVMDEYDKLVKASIERTKLQAQQLGATVKSALVNAISQGVLSIVNAMMKGTNILSAFGNTILGIFGDLAIQTGTILIGLGIGLQSLTTLDGLQALLAGIGLVAIGGVLKALSGGGGGTNEGVTSNGGGVAFTGNQQLPGDEGLTSFQAAERQAPNTVVNFTVQGDILDSDSTQSRIVALLNDAIDTKGAVVRGLA